MPLVELSIYVPTDEADAIESNADQYDGSRSEYVRSQLQECDT